MNEHKNSMTKPTFETFHSPELQPIRCCWQFRFVILLI